MILKQLIVLSLLLIFSALSFAHAITPIGKWQTYDNNHAPRSIIQLSVINNQLSAKIVEVLPNKDRIQQFCEACKGKLHNKPLVGLTIIWGLEKNKNKWEKGHVLDIDSGHIYNCSLTLSPDNKILYFHAYMGSPLLGRTLEWIRSY